MHDPLRNLTEADWRAPYLLGWCGTTDYGGGTLTPREMQRAIEDAHTGQRRTLYTPIGPEGYCFQNVMHAATNGCPGKPVMGWRITGTTLFAPGVELEAHAVWEDVDGQLFEFTVGQPGCNLFAASSTVTTNLAFNIQSGYQSDLEELYRRMLYDSLNEQRLVRSVAMLPNPLAP